MNFPLFEASSCRFCTFAGSWWGGIRILSRRGGKSSSSKKLGINIHALEGGPNRRWTRRSLSTKTGHNTNILSSKTSYISQQISGETVSKHTKLSRERVKIDEHTSTQHQGIQEKIYEGRELAKLTTIFVFDIETTGFSRVNERIIEIALQDLSGGENSTFTTLINPKKEVCNSDIHGISTQMVNKSTIPRMEDLIPILMCYAKSRMQPGGQILWIAHNARTFDVPFLINEFRRCSYDIPTNWRFLDTLPLARELMPGSKRLKLEHLREKYGIPLAGAAHRAMSDVTVLAAVYQRMTYELKLTTSCVLGRSFTACDLINKSLKVDVETHPNSKGSS